MGDRLLHAVPLMRSRRWLMAGALALAASGVGPAAASLPPRVASRPRDHRTSR